MPDGPDRDTAGKSGGLSRACDLLDAPDASRPVQGVPLQEQKKALRVLIAENHRDLSDIMSQLIDTEPDLRCVGQVAEAGQVLAAARRTEADVLILDLMLHGGSEIGRAHV